MKPNSKYFDRIRIRPLKEEKEKIHLPSCQWDGCSAVGAHRAPVGRMKEGRYFHLCIDHVRLYNKNFNYFSGLSDNEITRFQKEALTGHLPTWSTPESASMRTAPEFARMRSGSAAYHSKVRNPDLLGKAKTRAKTPPRVRKPKALEAKALATLGLDVSSTSKQIKSRYKELVKLHHPDANGGDRSSEDHFRDVIQAYQLLKQADFC